MILLFPSYPTNINNPDPAFDFEVKNAKQLGFTVGFVSIELMLGGDVILKIPQTTDSKVMYRGWILKEEQYISLYKALLERNLELINSPEQYNLSQLLPLWYPHLKDNTPESAWIPGNTFSKSSIEETISIFKDSPIIIKDYMKSRKQDWFDACYIDSASNLDEVHRVPNNFLN